jgi:N-acetylglucosamine-6-phosphate deacetylase
VTNGRATVIARRVVTTRGILGDHELVVEDGSIAAIRPAGAPPVHEVLIAGGVDLQVNGHDDVDVATMTAEQLPRMRSLLAAQGTTTWFPTLITSSPAHVEERLGHLADLAAEPAPGPAIGGVHLEGPYLGARHGAHRGVPDGPIDLGWLDALPDLVRIVTLGPERTNAPEAIGRLVGRGVLVALGHTDAGHERTIECIDAGARLFTHCFNASTPLDHRDPGAVAAALTDDRMAISLIADLVHVHPLMLDLAGRCKPEDRIVLVTDAVGWRSGRLGSGRVAWRDGAPRLADGTLAGSGLTLDRAIANAADRAGWGLERAVRAATATPAGLVGLTDRGALEPGRRADLVALDADLRPVQTWTAGTPLLPPPDAHPGSH